MTFLRNVFHDLVDKKLWPIAAALLVAIVAVPVALGGSSEPAAGPAPGAVAAAAGSAPPASAEVAVAVEQPALRRRGGKTRDPFKQQYVVKTTDGAVSVVTGAAGAVAPVKDVGKTPDAVTPPTDGTSTTKDSTTKTVVVPELDPLDVYRVALRFGKTGKQKTIRNISRLSPLPNSEQPFFVFLGVLSGGKKAVFLVGADAAVTGDGVCRPSKTNCETVEMGKGDTVFLDRETDKGTIQYELELTSVTRRSGAEAAAANKASTAASRKQAAAKDDAADDLTDLYRWDADRGVLVRRKMTRKTRASAATDPAPADAPQGTGHTAEEYRAWYIAVYLEYLRQLAAGTQQVAQDTAAVLDAVPQP